MGAALGLLLGAPVASLVEYPLESLAAIPVVWLIGFPLGGAMWWLLQPWIARGQATLAAAVVPQVVVLVNLLAAGALTFPGVMSTLLVLIPAACLLANRRPAPASSEAKRMPGRPAISPGLPLARTRRGTVWVGAVILTAACLLTEYLPVMYGRLAVAQALYALQTGDGGLAQERAVAATQADRLSPEPWRLLADLRLSRWLASGEAGDREAFDTAASEYRRRDPHHHVACWGYGNWYLTAWRKSGSAEDLGEALTSYTQAATLYPNRALYHAQLAWVFHLAGKEDRARQAAEHALKLDSMMPHSEQKLARQRIIDPQFSSAGLKLPREETAEQTVERLRKTTAEEMP
jgi:hypothetical protein